MKIKHFLLNIFIMSINSVFAQGDYEPRGNYYSNDVTGNPMNFEDTATLLIIGILLAIFGYVLLSKTKGSWGLIGVLFLIAAFVCVAPAIISLLSIFAIIAIVGFVIFILISFLRDSKK